MKTAVLVALASALFVAVESYYVNPEPTPRPKEDCHNYSPNYAANGVCNDLYQEYGYGFVASHGVHHVYPDDCTCHVQCNWHISNIVPCANGTVWFQNITTCVHGQKINGKCYPTHDISPIPPYPIRQPEDCQGYNTSDTFCSDKNQNVNNNGYYQNNFQQYFEYPKDCSCFYQCDESGNTHTMPCANATVWDQSKLTCVRPCPDTCTNRYNPVQIYLEYCPNY